jgi:membrane-associated phospholipid phosphatase
MIRDLGWATYYYPHALALAYLAFLFLFGTSIPDKGAAFLRAAIALAIASFLAHVNLLLDFWPTHRHFPSGHMTFSLGLSYSLGLIRPWTLAMTIPLVVLLGVLLVVLGFHSTFDVLGAIPLVLAVYAVVYGYGRRKSGIPPLDSRTTSA